MWVLWVILAAVLGILTGGFGNAVILVVCTLACIFVPFFGLAKIIDHYYGWDVNKRCGEEIEALRLRKQQLWDEKWEVTKEFVPFDEKEGLEVYKKKQEEYIERRDKIYAEYEYLEKNWDKEVEKIERKYYGNRYDTIKRRRGY